MPEPNWRDLLRRHGIRPNKRFGQHFLLDGHRLDAIVRAAELPPETLVLEIGAGVGSLTWHLAHAGYQVVAVELDTRLRPALDEAVAQLPGVRLVYGDILTLPLESLHGSQPHAVVANIPYGITSALLRRLLEAETPAFRVVLTVQQEVAARVASGPGQMSLLALSVQVYGAPAIAAVIPAAAFHPPPEVDSAVLRIDRYEQPRVQREWVPVFFDLARGGFSQRRKKLRNALASSLQAPAERVDAWLARADLPAGARAQELGIEDWLHLCEAVAAGP
ncbi:MAG: 16S rRNA (adenine(1518)-N(6)/adenine(1519)-N(6))-dimethyltransferase RsmA [Anaerolineales bacterium]|nr:16S rRNA (adenine(1518)-N(6)/adenine(1519)-N(6))-dimethyltransferase RsmA [Anaerolineales bacterium]